MIKNLPILIVATMILASAPSALAQIKSVEVTDTYELTDTEAQTGDILILGDQGLVRASSDSDSRIFGVVSTSPLVAYRDVSQVQTPVARNGIANVNVTNLGGPIKVGDYITSSAVVGKGQKQANSGYVIGQALADFDESTATDVDFEGAQYKSGTVQVSIRIEYAELTSARTFTRLLNNLNGALNKYAQRPEQFGQILRYLAALIIIVMSLIFGYLVNIRAIGKSIEAIGRNPLAKTDVNSSLRVNFIFAAVIVAVGIGAAAIVILL